MNELAIELHTGSKKHLYEQIYEYIVREIKTGKLHKDEKLPSTRSLAEYLQISRSTVELAYEQLVSEGYLEARAYRGYYVAKIEELFSLSDGKKIVVPDNKKAEKQYLYDFSPNGMESKAFPFTIWKTIQKNALSETPNGLFELGDARGEAELRNSIAHYLHISRGVLCEPEQIIVGAGNDYLLMLLEKILGKGLTAAIENPTYKRAYRIFKNCGYKIRTIPMDEQGMEVSALKESGADIAYVMPSHQFPMGIVMPIGRRIELLRWANEEENRYIIEDDYDSEFRYRGKPIPALQASDRNGKVVYVGTFSKSIAPAIRISYMVLPPTLLKQYEENAYFYSSTVSRIDQVALQKFIADGYFERHLNKMRKIYKVKHDLLLNELKPLKEQFQISGENAGLHLLLTYKGEKTEEELLEAAEQGNVKVYALSNYRVAEEIKEKREQPILILGFAGLSEQQIIEGTRMLKEQWL